MRVVLDANVFASALIRPSGPPGQILKQLIEHEAFELIVSESILDELKRILAYPRIRRCIPATESELELWVMSLALLADFVEKRTLIPTVCRDPEDDHYLAAAIDGRAEVLVTGDQDLLVLKSYEEIRMVTPFQFLAMLQKEQA